MDKETIDDLLKQSKKLVKLFKKKEKKSGLATAEVEVMLDLQRLIVAYEAVFK